MTRRPRHTRPDSNHQSFARLREFGFLMVDTHDLGGEALDWLVAGWNLRTGRQEMIAIEVKPGPEAPFTAKEKAVLSAWHQVAMVAYDIEDVLRRYGRIE